MSLVQIACFFHPTVYWGYYHRWQDKGINLHIWEAEAIILKYLHTFSVDPALNSICWFQGFKAKYYDAAMLLSTVSNGLKTKEKI